MNVAAVLMEILRSAGVRRLFGNPGTHARRRRDRPRLQV